MLLKVYLFHKVSYLRDDLIKIGVFVDSIECFKSHALTGQNMGMKVLSHMAGLIYLDLTQTFYLFSGLFNKAENVTFLNKIPLFSIEIYLYCSRGAHAYISVKKLENTSPLLGYFSGEN